MVETSKKVVVAGPTGLVGREIIRLLEERPEVEFTALVRKTGRLRALSGRVQEVLFDYEDPASYERLGTEIPCDVLLCALGTTLKVAGSPEAFQRVDRDYPVALMNRLAKLDPRPVFGVVSSVGAAKPKGLYLRTKAEMERALLDSGLPFVVARPSLLLGRRREYRLAERLAALLLAKPYLYLARALAPRSRLVWRYAPIEAALVARALVRTCVDDPPGASGSRVLQGLSLHHPILDLGLG